jgi:DNA-binding transcriptional LysR family regulator
MEIAALKLFVEIAKLGSLAEVARRHELDPATISRNLAGLEAELGTRLFQRTTRRLSLTPAGQDYLDAVEGVVDQLDLARERALSQSDALTGTLRMTTSYAIGQVRIASLLPKFREKFPLLKLELNFNNAFVDLVSERMDLAIRLSPRIEGDYIAAKLFDTRYHVVASPAYAKRNPVADPKELAALNCLTLDITNFRKQWHFRDQGGKVTSVKINSDVTISSSLAMLDCVLAGMGPAMLPDWLIGKMLKEGRLVELFPDHRVTATDFETGAWLVYPSRQFLPRRVRVAIDFFKEHMRS